MSIVRVGSNEKYSAGWETAFGGKPAKKKSAGTKTAAKKATSKKTAAKKGTTSVAAKKKSGGKKKGAKR